MSAKRDALANVGPVQSIAPQAITADVNGTSAEVRGFEEVEIILDVGLFTDGAATIVIEESSDDSTFTTVAAADLDGSVPTLSAANDNQLHRIGYMGSAPYLRVTVTEATSPAPTGVVMSALIHRRRPHHAPVA